MKPYCVIESGEMAIVVEEGDVLFQLSQEEAEYSEAIVRYFMQVAKEEHMPMLQALLDRITITPSVLH